VTTQRLRIADCGLRIEIRNPKSEIRNHLAFCLLPFAFCLAFPCLAWAADWKWELPVARYRTLDVFQRAQYDKAAKLLQENSFQAAASEFEKFKVQFPDSPALAYVLFMRGYCLHQAKTRNQAIKIYNEVLDYFSEEVSDAAPAKYFMGLAHLENGDIRQGVACLKQLLTNESYAKHPLAGSALARLAEIHWRNKEADQAVKLWKQIARDFRDSNHREASQARDSLVAWYIKSKDYAGYEAWLAPTAEARAAKDFDEAKHRVWMATQVIDKAHHHIFPHHTGHYNQFEQQQRAEAVRAAFAWFKAQKPWFDKATQTWDYLSRALSFLTTHYGDKKERDPVVDEMVGLVKKVQDKAEANGKYAWIVDRLREGNDVLRARYVVSLIADPPLALYKDSELLNHEQKHKEAVARLEEIEKLNIPQWTLTAQERKAWVYKDCLANYEAAIKIYRQINKPPGTLWAIQECFIRWGKLDDAVNTLSEIENSFPEEAAKAAWHKAHYYHQASQGKKAIAQARKILKAYKASPEASKAHQLLEGYGVATGGGVFEEE